MYLLANTFFLYSKEMEVVRKVVIFTLVFYVKAWLRSPLSASAARNDLEFHLNAIRYREMEPKAAFNLIKSIGRHQWYTTAQMVTLALADPELEAEERRNWPRHSMEHLRRRSTLESQTSLISDGRVRMESWSGLGYPLS